MSLVCLELAKILIIDDEETNLRLLERILHQEGFYQTTALIESIHVQSVVEALRPDLILLDLHMPQCDGFKVLEQLQSTTTHRIAVPIIVLTADTTPDTRHRALRAGAKDFLIKPFDMMEVVLRIRNLLEHRALQQNLSTYNEQLEAQVKERTRHLEEAQEELLARLALTAEYRDDDTGLHSQRVGIMAGRIAKKLGLSADEVEQIERTAPLHDIGKIGIPDHILLKPSRLTEQEFAIIKRHTTIGAKILAQSPFPLLQVAAEIAHSHHERWDGSGYPCGLSGDAIPLVGRIVAVSDAVDAMNHSRPYKSALAMDQVVNELRQNAGRQFDPAVVEACIAVFIEDGLIDNHALASPDHAPAFVTIPVAQAWYNQSEEGRTTAFTPF